MPLKSIAPGYHRGNELVRLRSDAAVVRTLLEEVERAIPNSNCPGAGGGDELPLREQVVDELARLGKRLIDCAATMQDALNVAGTGDSGADDV